MATKSYSEAFQGLKDVGNGKRQDKYGRTFTEQSFTDAAKKWNMAKYGSENPTADGLKSSKTTSSVNQDKKLNNVSAAVNKDIESPPKGVISGQAGQQVGTNITRGTALKSAEKSGDQSVSFAGITYPNQAALDAQRANDDANEAAFVAQHTGGDTPPKFEFRRGNLGETKDEYSAAYNAAHEKFKKANPNAYKQQPSGNEGYSNQKELDLNNGDLMGKLGIRDRANTVKHSSSTTGVNSRSDARRIAIAKKLGYTDVQSQIFGQANEMTASGVKNERELDAIRKQKEQQNAKPTPTVQEREKKLMNFLSGVKNVVSDKISNPRKRKSKQQIAKK